MQRSRDADHRAVSGLHGSEDFIVYDLDDDSDGRPNMKEIPVRHRILGIARSGGVLAQLDPLLESLNSELYVAPDARMGLEMVKSLGAVDLVLVEHPLASSSVRSFLADLRHLGKGQARMAVLVAPDALESLDDPDDPDCIILSLDHSTEEMGALLGALLEHAPRVPVHLMVRLEVEISGRKVLRFAQTENISKTGMLLRSTEEIADMATIEFEFFIPDDSHPIAGEASIARRISKDGKKEHGLALRFERLLGSDQLRLEHFLNAAEHSA